MPKNLALPYRLLHVARMILAFAGRPISKWSPRPPLPESPSPSSFALGRGVTLWRLPVGLVRVRERHRALPPDLADVDDKLRFPVMMSDRRMTGWLDCDVWLVDHPERRILIDTGESASFGEPAYFGAAMKGMGRIYPKIIDGTAAPGNDLFSRIAATGHALPQIDLCVLTHTHSDHVGNIDSLSQSTRLLVSPEELAPVPRSGRLLAKLPQDGRVQLTDRFKSHQILGSVMPLTERGDVFVVATPGHTGGHQSVVIDLGERQVVLAGDAAFDDDQVAGGVIPGIVEDRASTLRTYDLLKRAARVKPTLRLFTHDPANAEKLRRFTRAA